MNNPCLSNEDIQKLYQFVGSKSVEYVDVQHEIVDHLASGIEEQLRLNPNIHFEDALQYEYRKFPLTGFIHFVETKEKEYRRYWNKKMKNTIQSYLKLPRLGVLLLLMSISFFVTTVILPNYPIPFNVSIGFIVFVVVSVLFLNVKYWYRNKNLLIVSSYYKELPEVHGLISLLLIDPMNFVETFSFLPNWALINATISSLLVAMYVISLHASYFVFPKMLNTELQKQNISSDLQKLTTK